MKSPGSNKTCKPVYTNPNSLSALNLLNPGRPHSACVALARGGGYAAFALTRPSTQVKNGIRASRARCYLFRYSPRDTTWAKHVTVGKGNCTQTKDDDGYPLGSNTYYAVYASGWKPLAVPFAATPGWAAPTAAATTAAVTVDKALSFDVGYTGQVKGEKGTTAAFSFGPDSNLCQQQNGGGGAGLSPCFANVPKSMRTSSSVYSTTDPRYDTQRQGVLGAVFGWRAKTNTAGQWYQMDLGKTMDVAGIHLQEGEGSYLKTFTLSYSTDNMTWSDTDGGMEYGKVKESYIGAGDAPVTWGTKENWIYEFMRRDTSKTRGLSVYLVNGSVKVRAITK